MSESDPKICLAGASEVAGAVEKLAEQLFEKLKRPASVAFIGIHTHGVPLAQRLKALFDKKYGVDAPIGTVDITLYRDDYDLRGVKPRLQSSRVRFSIDEKEIVLVDDVLYTGRTIRAAIESLGDYGRPDSIRLATLVDRGHRELPIQPDAVGLTFETRKKDRIVVQMTEIDGMDQVILVKEGSHR